MEAALKSKPLFTQQLALKDLRIVEKKHLRNLPNLKEPRSYYVEFGKLWPAILKIGCLYLLSYEK